MQPQFPRFLRGLIKCVPLNPSASYLPGPQKQVTYISTATQNAPLPRGLRMVAEFRG